jgi:hypothetical protein
VETIDAFNARQQLTRGDVKIMRSSVLCSFRRSKSNQLNEWVHKVLALAMRGKILDPKLAVERAFAVSPHTRSSDPAFMIPPAKGPVLLTHYIFFGRLKHCLRAIGVDASLYSGQSFLRGSATHAHRLGVDPMLIK